MDNFFKNFYKDYEVYFGHQDLNLVNQKNYFFIKQNFLPHVDKIDFFISSYVCDYFTKNSNKIYIHHDIYDTPIVNNKQKIQIKKRLNKYDYFFVSNLDGVNFFKSLLVNKDNAKNKIYEIGYIKLDTLKKRRVRNINSNSIVIAPTNIHSFKEFSIKNRLKNIIEFLLGNTSYDIFLRPHPSNRNDDFFINLKKKFSNNKKFFYDISEDYFNIYLNSKLLITDISGTAYTYSFLTNNPVLFLYHSKSLLKKFRYEKLNYFKDMSKIGYKFKTLNDILTIIKIVNQNKSKISKKIRNLRKNKIHNLNKSLYRFKSILKELKNERNN